MSEHQLPPEVYRKICELMAQGKTTKIILNLNQGRLDSMEFSDRIVCKAKS